MEHLDSLGIFMICLRIISIYYNGESEILAQDHVDAFVDFFDNMYVDNNNVYMQLFVQIIKDDVRKWFQKLCIHGTLGWKEGPSIFFDKVLLIKEEKWEFISYFNKWFKKNV